MDQTWYIDCGYSALYVTRLQRVSLVFVAENITDNMEVVDSTRSSGSDAVLNLNTLQGRKRSIPPRFEGLPQV